jgi:MSHA biogenesis protein MshN
MSVASTSAKDSVSGIQQEVNRQLQSGDKAGAIKNLTRVLAIEPRNLSARKKLASLHFGLGNTAIASELLQQGIALAPSDSAMRLMLARLLFRADNPDSALQLLKAHPRSVIADDELLSFRAALAEKQGDYGQAIEDYSQLIDRQQTNARWWLGLAVSQDKQSLRQEAITSYRRAQTLNQLSDQVSTFVQQRLSVLEG